MTRDEYNKLFHRAHVNEVAFKQVNDCDDELRKMVEMAIADEREACANICDVLAVHPEYASQVTKLAAQAIRARGEK